jgi:hypothetical protein
LAPEDSFAQELLDKALTEPAGPPEYNMFERGSKPASEEEQELLLHFKFPTDYLSVRTKEAPAIDNDHFLPPTLEVPERMDPSPEPKKKRAISSANNLTPSPKLQRTDAGGAFMEEYSPILEAPAQRYQLRSYRNPPKEVDSDDDMDLEED